MTRDRLRAGVLVRRILLPPLLAGFALVALLVVLAAGASPRAKATNPLGGATDLVAQLRNDLEGTPSAIDVLRARKPPRERKKLLDAHPYYRLYRMAKRRFDVPWLLVAAVHYQETGFGKASDRLAHEPAWYRHKYAMRGLRRPASYPNRSERHPSIRDDFDVVMSIAGELKSAHAGDLRDSAARALAVRYGTGPQGRLSAAMVLERARAWKILGTIPLPGRGELARPIRGIVPGCGYFGCPRPGHLHNGLDLLAPAGTPIHASDSGEVALLESVGESGGYGNFICLQHRPHLATCYAHLSAVAAGMKIGAHVRRGEVIGLVGSTGSSSATHLHFEVRRGPAACQTCAVDPSPFLDGEVPQATVPEMVALASRIRVPGRAVAPRAAARVPAPSGEPEPEPEHVEAAHELRAPSLADPQLPAHAPKLAPARAPATATVEGGTPAPPDERAPAPASPPSAASGGTQPAAAAPPPTVDPAPAPAPAAPPPDPPAP